MVEAREALPAFPGRVFWILFACFLGAAVAIVPLSFALASAEGASIGEAGYSTVLTALLAGPTLDANTSLGRSIVILTLIDGLVLIESSIAWVITLLQTILVRSELNRMIDSALERLSRREGEKRANELRDSTDER